MYQVKDLLGYPDNGIGSVPRAALRSLEIEYPKANEADLRALARPHHYEEVKKAYKVISDDLNGNDGLALARVFADEHPYLQNQMFLVLGLGMRARHPELERAYQRGELDLVKVDGRVSTYVAKFVAAEMKW